MEPRMRARAESSGRVSVVGTKGLKVGLGGVDVAMMTRLPLARASFSLDGSVSARARCASIHPGGVDSEKSAVAEDTLARELRVLDESARMGRAKGVTCVKMRLAGDGRKV